MGLLKGQWTVLVSGILLVKSSQRSIRVQLPQKLGAGGSTFGGQRSFRISHGVEQSPTTS